MKIAVLDHSVARIAAGDDAEPQIHGGKITYDLYFRCAHLDAIVGINDEPFAHRSVYCLGCKNEDLLESEAEEMLA